ncbi:MAG: Crp/Fnr family transcriptional regulator [Ruminococcaceae bacterium]|nr:Crp/Fnr family transcriptional regulator [Oscillospiraceae bacterium]
MENCPFAPLYQRYFPFWDALSGADKEILCRSSVMAQYEKGETVHDSTECTGVILVKTGCLRLYMLSDEGKEITLYRLFAGDICILSASCVLQSITFDVFVDAEEESECCVVGGCAFSDVSERNPAVKIFALETALGRFSDVMWVMQQILFMSMDKRLAIFLLDEASQNGTDTIRLTHEQIAKYMGTAREVVSRMLKYFSSEGIVSVSRKGVALLDKKRLRALAG